jgi:3-deoxy-manno-octulosonate cytidylyltransferase (CMP-KDO synthetase)
VGPRPARPGAARPPAGALRHLGLYSYRVGALQRLAAAPPCQLENTERLEQLRALWLGLRIQADVALEVPPAGIDTPADLERVSRLLAANRPGR